MAVTATKKGWRLALAALLGLYSLGSSAQDEARDWLDRMSQALRTTNYQGILVYSHNEQLETLRIVHEVRDGMEHERLIHLNGAPREVVRQGQQLSGSAFARNFARNIGAIEQYYQLTLQGQDRIAGRQAVRLRIQPNDQHRYGYQLWVDRHSSLLLKSILQDTQGRTLEQFQFTTLQVMEPPSALPAQPHAPEPDLNPAPSAPMTTAWQMGWLPPGFTLTYHDRQPLPQERLPQERLPQERLPQERLPQDQMNVERMMFSDGLAAFTVFIEPSRQSALTEGIHSIGATVAVVRRVPAGQEDYFVTLIGEVPVASAQRIAASIRKMDTERADE